MQLTIIPSTNTVVYDGVARTVDMDLPIFHALQWYGTSGELEVLGELNIAIDSETELSQIVNVTEVISAWTAAAPPPPPPPPRRMVPKSTIVTRLNTAGKLSAASSALNADLYTRERWYAPDKPALYFDDPEALALLQAIGADPAVIMAEGDA